MGAVKKQKKQSPSDVAHETLALKARVEELEETLRAIRMGEVDAVLVSSSQGDQVFTLQGAEHPYRLLVETIEEGAATLSMTARCCIQTRASRPFLECHW